MDAHNESTPHFQEQLADLQRRLAAAEAQSLTAAEQLRAFHAIQQSFYLLYDVTDRRATEAALRESEAKLHSLMHHMPEVVLIIGRDDRIEHANRCPWGTSVSELVGSHLTDYFRPACHADIVAHLDTVWRTETPQLYEAQDTRDSWWLIRAVILKDGLRPNRVMVICTDVTRLRQGEESLRKSEEELRCLFDNIPDFVLLIDHEATIKFANRPSPGASVRQLLGTKGFAFIDPDHLEACRHALALAMASHRPQEVEMRDVFGHWWACRLVPMPREDRSAGEVMLICADVTARKQTEISLRKSESRYRALFEFTANAALIWDGDVILDCNDAAVHLFGYTSREAMVGQAPDLDAPRQLDGTDSRSARAALTAAAHERGSVRCEWLARRFDGTEFIADLLVTSIPLEDRQLVMCVGHDITQRKQDERIIRESEQRFKALAENSPNMIFIDDMEGRVLYANSMCEEVLKFSREELYTPGFNAFTLLAPESHAVAQSNWESYLAGRDVPPFEYTMLTKTGERITSIVATKLMEHEGSRAVLGVITDITRRKQDERALRDSEQRYRLITENLLDWIWTSHVTGMNEIIESGNVERIFDRWQWTFVSSSIQRLLGYTVEEGMQLSLSRLLTHSSNVTANETIASVLALWRSEPGKALDALTAELEFVKKTGDTVWCEVTVRPTCSKQGELTGFEGVARDIAERKHLERKLAELVDQRRQEMAQQLHDELGQDLLGMRLMAESLRRSLAAKMSPEATVIGELSAAAELAQDRLRQIIKGVSPVEVAPQGLMAALEDLADHTQRFANIACEFRCHRSVSVDNSHIATELFYIAQEAVRNAVKHAQPANISIGLAGDDHQLSLWVADDGIGMTRKAEVVFGMGLRIMKHRAAVINAALSIRQAAPHGTLVTCKLPLRSRTDS